MAGVVDRVSAGRGEGLGLHHVASRGVDKTGNISRLNSRRELMLSGAVRARVDQTFGGWLLLIACLNAGRSLRRAA